MIDFYSKFVIIETLENLQSSNLINVRNFFFTIWDPKGVSNLNSVAIIRDFEHQTISLHFHQSNGLVERSIQSIKCTLKKQN